MLQSSSRIAWLSIFFAALYVITFFSWKRFYLCSLTFTKIKPCCYDEMVMVLVSIVDLAAASSLALSLSERIQLVHFYRLCVAVDDNEEAGGLVY